MHTAGLGRAALLIFRRNRKPRARTKDWVGLVCHGHVVEPLKDMKLLLKTCCSRRLPPEDLLFEDLGSRSPPVAEPWGRPTPVPPDGRPPLFSQFVNPTSRRTGVPSVTVERQAGARFRFPAENGRQRIRLSYGRMPRSRFEPEVRGRSRAGTTLCQSRLQTRCLCPATTSFARTCGLLRKVSAG
jgi:hypothetical protein